MTEGYKKKLIEVAMPLEAINNVCVKEKSIRHGHPSTLHLWWARRPLAACRAVIFAQLLDDPSNFLPEKEAAKARKQIFKFIEKLVQWESTNNKDIMKEANQMLVESIGKNLPDVLDPFCGGGSIPLESLRLGIPTFASDLNPVPVLINKSLIEIPQRFANKSPVNPDTKNKLKGTKYKDYDGLIEDIKYYADKIKKEAKTKIGTYYPFVNKSMVVAYLWARSIKCSNPACQAEVPLIRILCVSKAKSKYVYPKYSDSTSDLTFEIKSKNGYDMEGNVTRTGVICYKCKSSMPLNYVREEAQKGRMSQKLTGIVITKGKSIDFVDSDLNQEKLAKQANPEWRPDTELVGKSRVSVPLYGMSKHGDLFTKRQLLALTTFSDLVIKITEQIRRDAINSGLKDDNLGINECGKGAKAYSEAVATYLGFAIDRCANYWSSLTPWGGSFIVQTFGRQAIPMVWDFAEANPFSDRTGNWMGAVEWITLCIEKSIPSKGEGKVMQLDATQILFPNSTPVICTDPPYYDNICYADLSDYFYVWLRKTLGNIYPALFSTMLSPKNNELIASPYLFDGDMKKAEKHFTDGFKKTFSLFAKKSNKEFPIAFFYAFMQVESESDSQDSQQKFSSTGWETMLEGLIGSGLTITATWPLRTERDQGLKTGDNVLASSIVLVCRPRIEGTPIATRRDFINTLKKELPLALRNLQEAGIAPVDMAQCAIGPGMAVFSRYSKVLEADGTQMTVRTALQIINQELDAYFTEQESDMDKETRFCIAWYEQFGWKEAAFGDANTLATAKGTAVNTLENAGVIYAKAGKVRLLKRTELDVNWDPTTDKKLTIWECVQHLIKALEDNGESGAAEILKKIGGLSEPVKELSYRLYALSEKKGWTEDGLAYNNLISSWQSVTDKAQFAEQVSSETKKKLKDKSQKTLNDL